MTVKANEGDTSAVPVRRAAGATPGSMSPSAPHGETVLIELSKEEAQELADNTEAWASDWESSEGERIPHLDRVLDSVTAFALGETVFDALDDGIAEKWSVNPGALLNKISAATPAQIIAIVDRLERDRHVDH